MHRIVNFIHLLDLTIRSINIIFNESKSRTHVKTQHNTGNKTYAKRLKIPPQRKTNKKTQAQELARQRQVYATTNRQTHTNLWHELDLLTYA